MESHRGRRQHLSEGWVGGVVLIALGVLFLLQNTAGITLNNWWALFILIPALGSFAAAWRLYRDAGGRLTGAVIGPITGGLVLTAVAAAFLFGWDWSFFWPALLILAGLGALARAMIGRE